MRKAIVFCVGLILCPFLGQAQTYIWANSAAGYGSGESYAISTDNAGNIYITGCFSDTADFDPGPNVANLVSRGLRDVFIAKYDSDGNYIWAHSGGGTAYNKGAAVTVDAAGNVYITGWFQGVAYFNSDTDTIILNAIGNRDLFCARYDDNGNLVWALAFGDASITSDEAFSITADQYGNVILAGRFGGTVDFDPGLDTANLVENGLGDIFIAKFDSSGNYIWAHAIGGISQDEAYSITSDDNGNVYVTGWFADTVDFDPGPGNASLVCQGGRDIFIAKYDSSGNYQWAIDIGDSTWNAPQAFSISVDDIENVYITGRFGYTIDFDPSPDVANLVSDSAGNSIFIAKYDQNGNYLWAHAIGGEGSNIGWGVQASGSNNVFITGSFQNTVDFDPGVDTFLLSSDSFHSHTFIAKFNGVGDFIWSGSINSSSASCVAYGIANDPNGNILITGDFQGTTDFDPGLNSTTLSSQGMGSNVFIAKYDSDSMVIITNTNEPITKKEKYGISVHPNPFTEYIIMEYVLDKEQKIRFEIYNLQGQLLESVIEETQGQGIYSYRIDLNQYRAGVYLYKFTADQRIMAGKLVLAR